MDVELCLFFAATVSFSGTEEWQNLEGAVPSPAIQPEEALGH